MRHILYCTNILLFHVVRRRPCNIMLSISTVYRSRLLEPPPPLLPSATRVDNEGNIHNNNLNLSLDTSYVAESDKANQCQCCCLGATISFLVFSLHAPHKYRCEMLDWCLFVFLHSQNDTSPFLLWISEQ